MACVLAKDITRVVLEKFDKKQINNNGGGGGGGAGGEVEEEAAEVDGKEDNLGS